MVVERINGDMGQNNQRAVAPSSERELGAAPQGLSREEAEALERDLFTLACRRYSECDRARPLKKKQRKGAKQQASTI
jgi:hypothetical protein